jgi:hypothetical protein
VHLTVQRKESFGLAPVEAQACGLPVLASAWGGVRDTVLAGETGHYAPVRLESATRHVAWDELVEPALALLADEVLRRRFGTRARAWVVECFSIVAFAARLDAFLARWSTRPHAAPDVRRVTLSAEADAVLVAFAEVALRHPAEDSRALSDRLLRTEAGARAQRTVLDCLAGSWPAPEAPRTTRSSSSRP